MMMRSLLLDAVGQKRFHSEVAKIHLWRRSICGQESEDAVSNCCQRTGVQGRTTYLHTSKAMVMKYACGGMIELLVFVDVSWAIHDEAVPESLWCLQVVLLAHGRISKKWLLGAPRSLS